MRLRQVALAAHDLDAVTGTLCDVLELEIGYRDPGVAVFGLVNAVIPIGHEFLEVVCPVKDDAPARRYLDRRGGDCGYMVMIQTADFDADRARADAMDIRVVWTGELPDIRGMHLHPRDTGGALLSLDQPQPADAWRWAGEHWTEHVRTRRVSGLRGVSVACLDPGRVADRWGALLERKPVATARGQRVDLEDGFVDFVAAASTGEEGVVGFTVVASDADAVLAAARQRGLATEAAAFVACGIRIELETDA